jgi:hypothetical protein
MKITATKSDLEAALNIATIGISAGSDLSAHYLFRVTEANTCEVLTYQSSITVSVPLKCEINDGKPADAMTVEGWRLTKWLSGVGDVNVTLENTDRGEVTVASPRSKVRLKALDPKKFPFWDKTLGEAKVITTTSAERLASALAYSKSFVYDVDTTRPDISQIEVIDGILWSTDKRAVTLISMEGMDKSNLRVHGKDIPSLLKFLSRSEEVELLEHDRSAFFRRKEDGATIGTSRPISQFPGLGVDPDSEDQMFWEISSEDLLAGIHCLSATTDKDNTRVKFLWEGGQVKMQVKAVVGGEDDYPMDPIEKDGLDKFPDGGFQMDHPYITHILGAQGGESLKFGLNVKKKGGYTSFRHTKDNDKYLTVVIWR